MSISVAGISKSFGSFKALDNVSLEIPPGQLTALLGPSGGGKSTLLRVIAGLEDADDGQVIIDGINSTALPVQKRNIGFVFQHYAAFAHMTVEKNVAFGLEIRKRPKDEVKERVPELLKLVHLEQFGHRLPSQLSGGQRQRMALARALAVEPSVLLLDEPFGALDARVRKELRQWLRRLHDEVHVTTVLVTHDQEEALEVADSIVVINEGRVEQTGSADDLYDRPESTFVMEFLGPVTFLEGARVRPHDIEIFAIAVRDATRGEVVDVQRVGFEVRVWVDTRPAAERAAGPDPSARTLVTLTRTHFLELGLSMGDAVWLRLAQGAPQVS